MSRFLILAVFLPSIALAQPAPPSVGAASFVLYEASSGQTIASQAEDKRVEPASLTKLMTAYLVFNALREKRLTLEQAVPVSERAWKTGGSRMFIEPRTPVTVQDLLRGMIVQSGNDASVALAEAVAGSEDVFAEMMNREAARLGMKNTHFTNATGLPDPQLYSTAGDLTLLAAAIIRDFPEYYTMYSEKEFTYNRITQSNRNRLLWLDPTVDGVKTGHTEAAGYCLITSSKRGERRLISTVLGTDSENARVAENQKLLNYGFQFFDVVRVYEKGQVVTSIPVWKGVAETVRAGLHRDLYLTVPKGQSDRLKAAVERQEPLEAPISPGQRVATVKVTLDGKPLAEHPLLALEAVGKAGIFGRAWDSVRMLFN